MTRAYIGLGSNLDDPDLHIIRAFDDLKSLPDTELLARASLYRSKPLGPGEQPDYINSAALLDTDLSAVRLLEHLMSIELVHGRTRGKDRWQPRTLDLDLLIYGQEQIEDEGLVVPHPEIENRNFVLVPLREITPDLEISGIGRIDELLQRVGTSDLEKID